MVVPVFRIRLSESASGERAKTRAADTLPKPFPSQTVRRRRQRRQRRLHLQQYNWPCVVTLLTGDSIDIERSVGRSLSPPLVVIASTAHTDPRRTLLSNQYSPFAAATAASAVAPVYWYDRLITLAPHDIAVHTYIPYLIDYKNKLVKLIKTKPSTCSMPPAVTVWHAAVRITWWALLLQHGIASFGVCVCVFVSSIKHNNMLHYRRARPSNRNKNRNCTGSNWRLDVKATQTHRSIPNSNRVKSLWSKIGKR